MSQLGRSAGLTGFMEVAREAGLEPYRLAARTGVPRAAFSNPDMMVSLNAMTALLDLAVRESGIEDFGLRMAERRRLATMGPMGLAVRQQTSLRAAISVWSDFGWAQNEGLSFNLTDDGDLSILRIVHTPWRSPAAADLVVASIFRAIQALRGSGWRPLEIRMVHAAPANPEPHRRFFGIAPRFGQDFVGIVMRRADVDAPIAGTDAAMAEEAVRYAERVFGGRRQQLSQRVRDLLADQLMDKGCSVDRIAEQIGVDRRTLHRRLAGEGVSYSELLTGVRRELAENLLATSERPLADIADALGFASLSVFAHWFRRNFGCTASRYRAQRATG